ncbi:MAG TPA: FAD binding domain-containing protein [Pseudonocardiaceae bacterium]
MTMIPDTFEYVAPVSLAEAIETLAANPANVPLAGGNGLLTLLKRGELRPATVVDLRRLEVLRGLSFTHDGRLRIGALTTLTELVDDQKVRAAHVPGALGDALAVTGDVQARNRATVGGTVASAAPGSDLAAIMLVLDATADIAGVDGSRVVPVAALLEGSALVRTGELITAVHLGPAEPGSAYSRLANRATLHAMCGVAVTVALGEDGTISRCRIAVTGAMPYAQRLPELEAALVGTTPPVIVPPQQGPSYVDDALASAAYRREMTSKMAERAFVSAVARARDA